MLLNLSVSVGSKKESVASCWVLLNELVEGSNGTSSLDDSVSGSLGESKSSDVDGRKIENSLVIGNGSDDDGSSAFLTLKKRSEL